MRAQRRSPRFRRARRVEGVLVVEAAAFAFPEPLLNFVHLRHEERGRSCRDDGKGSRVSRVESRDYDGLLVGQSGFEPARLSGDVLRMACKTSGTSPAATDRLEHHQIDFDVRGDTVDIARDDPRADDRGN